MLENRWKIPPEMALYLILIAAVSLGNGLSDSVYSNYFKEVYNVTAQQRGFIEFPRELPGVLCVITVAALSSLGNIRLSIISQILAFSGLLVLGLLTPSFSVMLIFLFINSMGMHLSMPVLDSLGLSLAEPDKVGRRMGQYASVRSVFGFAAALVVFFGFRLNWLRFDTDVKWVFIIGCAFFLIALTAAVVMLIVVKPPRAPQKKLNFVFRKEYKYYYLLTILHGVQKQIAYVYGTWVVVDLLLKKADTVALLSIASTFICIFFMNFLGRWIDRLGIKKMLFVEALAFIGVYTVYGFTVWGITGQWFSHVNVPMIIVYALFVLDRLSMQLGIVRTVYLRSIALRDTDITATLSMGTSLDHVVSILAAYAGGIIWTVWGSQWVFFMAAAFSLGNLIVAILVKPDKERKQALAYRAAAEKTEQS
ncbi:MAG: MFS transporter [Christensenellales bacterium]|jgi:MFS family permease